MVINTKNYARFVIDYEQSLFFLQSLGFYHMPSGEVPRQEFAGDLCSESRLITWNQGPWFSCIHTHIHA